MRKKILIGVFILFVRPNINAQHRSINENEIPKESGWTSIGIRNTINGFSHDGTGIGTGGQFRIQLNNQVKTDWFADYISISRDNIRSIYYHIGWSVLLYPFAKNVNPRTKFQPYVLAGHCFDFNKKTIMDRIEITNGRWGSAVQSGLGFSYPIGQRFDVSLTAQYMLHLTKELLVTSENGQYSIEKNNHRGIEGHLLINLSLNYKLFKL